MEKFIDRIMIFFLMVFAMARLFADRYLIVVIYISLIVTFFSYALCYYIKNSDSQKLKEYSRKVLILIQFFSIGLSIVFPKFLVILPVIMYDLFVMRNYFCIILAGLSFVFAYMGKLDFFSTGYLGLLSLISVYLGTRTEQRDNLSFQYKKLRDEYAVKEAQLKAHHLALIEMKDQEIFTAQLKERNRIAREIHDNVGHMLTRAILQLGALFTIYKEEPLNGQLGELKDTLDSAMNNIRTSVHDLHEESIDVEAALVQVTEPLKERYALRLEIDARKNIPVEVKYAVIGVVKEAVSNIVKHSINDTVDVMFHEHPSMYQLVVHDYLRKTNHVDYYVFETSDYRGMGLYNIESRVKSVGGNVEISRGRDFKIFVTIPKKK